MKRVICPVCGNICIKYGKNKSGISSKKIMY